MEIQDKYLQLETTIEEYREEMINFQISLTAIPAISPSSGGRGEWDKALFIKQFLQERGVTDIRQIDAPDERAKNGKRPNLVVRLPGMSHERTVWLLAHTDVVPEGDMKLWNSDPWKAEVKDGKIIGRGTEDNQQGLTSSIFAMLAFIKAGIMPSYDLALVLVADEETGSTYGLDYLLRHHADLFRKDDLIIVPDSGEPDSSMIEIAEKSIVWLRFRTVGKQCHGSLPDHGINAFKAASHLIIRLEALYDIFDARDELFAPPRSTFEPTQKEANVQNINTIPGEDIFYMDCRLLPNYSVQQLIDEIKKICKQVEKEFSVRIEIEPRQLAEAAPPTPPDAEVVRRLQRSIEKVYGIKARPMGIGGGTVAALFRRNGLPAAVWSTLDDVCHQPNEYCVIENMVKDTRVFAHLCLQP